MEELFKKHKDFKGYLVLVLAIVIALFGAFYYYLKIYSTPSPNLAKNTRPVKNFDVQGELTKRGQSSLKGSVLALYLSKDDRLSGIYLAGLLSGAIQRVNTGSFVISDFKHKNGVYAMAAVDKRLIKNSNKPSYFRDIYVSFSEPAFAFSKYKKLNVNKTAHYPSYLNISKDGKILFVATERKTPPDINKLNYWNIYLVDSKRPDRVELLVNNALYPAWISNDEFLFLSKDGLYKYSLKNKKVKKIWGIRGVADANMKFVLSPSAKSLAWSFVKDSKIVILKFAKNGILKEHSVNNAQVLDMLWVDDKHLLVVANTVDKKFAVMLLDTERGRILKNNFNNLDVDSLVKKGEKIFFLDYLK